jgi:hypothetical protein
VIFQTNLYSNKITFVVFSRFVEFWSGLKWILILNGILAFFIMKVFLFIFGAAF